MLSRSESRVELSVLWKIDFRNWHWPVQHSKFVGSLPRPPHKLLTKVKSQLAPNKWNSCHPQMSIPGASHWPLRAVHNPTRLYLTVAQRVFHKALGYDQKQTNLAHCTICTPPQTPTFYGMQTIIHFWRKVNIQSNAERGQIPFQFQFQRNNSNSAHSKFPTPNCQSNQGTEICQSEFTLPNSKINQFEFTSIHTQRIASHLHLSYHKYRHKSNPRVSNSYIQPTPFWLPWRSRHSSIITLGFWQF